MPNPREVAGALMDELQRLKECDEVLRVLYFHHQSQAKGACQCSRKWHKELVDRISKAKRGEPWR